MALVWCDNTEINLLWSSLLTAAFARLSSATLMQVLQLDEHELHDFVAQASPSLTRCTVGRLLDSRHRRWRWRWRWPGPAATAFDWHIVPST